MFYWALLPLIPNLKIEMSNVYMKWTQVTDVLDSTYYVNAWDISFRSFPLQQYTVNPCSIIDVTQMSDNKQPISPCKENFRHYECTIGSTLFRIQESIEQLSQLSVFEPEA